MMTTLAAHPEKTVFQSAALQEVAKLVLYILRQGSVLGGKLGQKAGQDVFTRLELKTGTRDTEALENIGGKLTFGWNIANEKTNIRLTGFYFNGYGKELSTYHLRTEYFGVGLEMR